MEDKKEEIKEEKKKEKSEKKNQENKKSHIILITVLIVLLLGAFFGFGYAVGGTKIVEKVTKKDTQEEGKKKEKTTEKEIEKENEKETKEIEKSIEEESDPLVKKAKELLLEFGINKPYGCNNYIYESAYNDNYKVLVVLGKLKDKGKEMACSEFFSESDIFYEGDNQKYAFYQGKTGVCSKEGTTTAIAYEDANALYQKLYGVDMPKMNANSLLHHNIYYEFYDYNESKNMFISLNCYHCGGACGPTAQVNEMKSVREEGNQLYIEVYYYHGNYNDLDGGRYHLETRNGRFLIPADSIETATQTIKDEYLDKLDVYQVVFEKRNDDYIFVSMTEKLS